VTARRLGRALRALALCALVGAAAAAIEAQDRGGAIVYGEGWAFLVSAPEGYKMDSRSLQKRGIWALFYREGQPAYRADLLNMYVNPFPEGSAPEGLEAFAEWDLDFFREGNPGLRASFLEEVELGDFSPCEVYSLDDEAKGYYMLHGYAVEPGASFAFVLVARGREERNANLEAYRSLLRSFVFMEKDQDP